MAFWDDTEAKGIEWNNVNNRTPKGKMRSTSGGSGFWKSDIFSDSYAKEKQKEREDWLLYNPGEELGEFESTDQADMRIASKRLQEDSDKPVENNTFWSDAARNVNDFTSGVNEAVFGGAIKSGVNLVNTIATRGDKKEADRRSGEFLSDIGIGSNDGNSALAAGTDRNSEASRWGQALGTTSDFINPLAGAADLASGAINQGRASEELNGSGALLDDQLVQNQKDEISRALEAGEIDKNRAFQLNDELDKKVAEAKSQLQGVEESIGVTPNQAEGVTNLGLLGATVAGARGAGTVAEGRHIGANVADRAAQNTKDRAAREALESQQTSGPKLLSEPTENFYQAERQQLADELDSINNLDPEYLTTNRLTTQTKDDARLKAEELAQRPEAIAAKEEASKLVADAEAQVKHYNDIKVQSPYHRLVDRAEDERNKEVAQLVQGVQDQTFDPQAARQLAAEADAKYQAKVQAASQKYPQDAAEAPIMDQALEEATRQQIDANRNLEKILQDEATTIKQSGGFLEVPDAQKIRVRQQEVQARLAEIDSRVANAKERATNPYSGTPESIQQRAEDIIDPELSPESFTPEGTIKPEAKAEYNKTRVESVKAKFGMARNTKKNQKLNQKVENNVTGDKVADNQTVDKALKSDRFAPETKARITNLNHKVHDDKKVLSNARALVDEDPLAARELFDSGAFLQSNADSHMALGHQLERYYNSIEDYASASKVLDQAATALGNAARGTRAGRFFSDMYSSSNLVKFLDNTAYDNGINISQAYRKDFQSRARAVDNMPEGPKKQAAQVLLKEEAEVKGAKNKIIDLLSQIIMSPRTIMASGDFSAIGRQAAPLGSLHPIIWAKTLRKQPKMLNDEYFEKTMQEIRDYKDVSGKSLEDAYRKAKLDLPAVHGKGEENFDNIDILAKTPLIKHYINASDRVYSGPLAYMRANVFKKLIDDMGGVDEFMKMSKKEQTDLGKYINTFSGRGGFKAGGAGEKAMEAASKTFFAARFWKSNIDKINPVYYANLSKPARKEALKNLAAWASVSSTILGAAAAMGADVETDPRSSDFGKIRVGDTRFDILGGTQQNMVQAARLITGQKTNVNGDTTELSPFGFKFGEEGFEGFGGDGPDAFGADSLSSLGDYVQNKTAPIPNLILTFMEGKDMAGNEIDPWKEIASLFVPLGIQGTTETFKETGGDLGLTGATLGANFYGIGANTYGSNNTALSSSDKAKIAEAPEQLQDMYTMFYQAAGNVTGRGTRDKLISKLYDEGKIEQARRKATEFNASVDEKMKSFFEQYPNIDEELQDELKNNVKITITPEGEKRRLK